VLAVVGLTRRSGKSPDRDLLALSAAEVETALAGFLDGGAVEEVAVVFTHFRVEVYAATRCPAAALLALRQALTARARRELPLFELHGPEAFRHLVRVVSSLDSPMLGEPEIVAQVKDAFRRAVEVGAAGDGLTGSLDRALEVARRIGRETTADCGCASWDDAAVALAEKVLGPLAGRRTAIAGSSETSRACARRFSERGASVVVLDGSISAAVTFAAEIAARARPLDALGDELLRADVVLSATPIPPDAFRPEAMRRISKARRRPVVIVDLSTAGAIPAETGLVRDVYLCDVEGLDRMMRAAMDERADAVEHAERALDRELARWSGARWAGLPPAARPCNDGDLTAVPQGE